MHSLRKLCSFLLCAVILLSLPAAAYADSSPAPFELTLLIDGGSDAAVRAYQESYEGNLYLSLMDLSLALNGTAAQFRLNYNYTNDDGESFTILPGQAAAPVTGVTRLTVDSRPSVKHLGLARHRFFVGESERKYYTYRSTDRDLYVNLTDLQLILNVTVEVVSESAIRVFPDRPFQPDLEALSAQGFFDVFNGIVLADADTGRALYVNAPNRVLPIASLSKLLGYYLLADAMDEGRFRREDLIPISQNADRLSRSADGYIVLREGSQVPAYELLDGMLLASSNECSLALAEHVAGSEEAFVEQMKAKAAELGLRTAEFYSCSGLPIFTRSALAAKLQNRMSAQDLFLLIRALLEKHPEITEITSKKYSKMQKLDYATANSNPLVFNLDGVNGLKTGNTDKAGNCLAVSLPVSHGGETHTIVLVLLGAENAWVRNQASEILLRYAQNYYGENGF